MQENDGRYATHKAWIQHRRLNQEDPTAPVLTPPVVSAPTQDIVFFENTPGYEGRLLEDELGGLGVCGN